MGYKIILNTAPNSNSSQPFSLCAFRGNKVILLSQYYVMKKSFPLCTLLIVLTSCVANHRTGELLNDVESYIQERPDSALKVLLTVSRESLGTKALKAQYSLLYTTALEKNYIDTTLSFAIICTKNSRFAA